MKAYLVSLAAGVVVGLIYSVMNVKSPAPPTIALVGLLGMLGGEHVIRSCAPGWQQVCIDRAGHLSHPRASHAKIEPAGLTRHFAARAQRALPSGAPPEDDKKALPRRIRCLKSLKCMVRTIMQWNTPVTTTKTRSRVVWP